MADETTTTKTTKTRAATSDDVEYVTIPVDKNLDEGTRNDLIRQLAPSAPGIVGNLADIQRAGAAIVLGEGKGLADGVETPPGVTDVDIAAAKAVGDASA